MVFDFRKKRDAGLTPINIYLAQKLTYCKRCYFRGINFSRLAAQKHIRGLLNSR